MRPRLPRRSRRRGAKAPASPASGWCTGRCRMGVDLYVDLLCGADARERQSDGRTFLERVVAGEFGAFTPPPDGSPDLEVFFSKDGKRWPFAVRTARDEHSDDPEGSLGASVVGIPLAQAA